MPPRKGSAFVQPNTAVNFRPNRRDGQYTVKELVKKQANLRRIDTLSEQEGIMMPWRSGLMAFTAASYPHLQQQGQQQQQNAAAATGAAASTNSNSNKHNNTAFIQHVNETFRKIVVSARKKRTRGNNNSDSTEDDKDDDGTVMEMKGLHAVAGDMNFKWVDQDRKGVGKAFIPEILNDDNDEDGDNTQNGGEKIDSALVQDGIVIEKGLTLPRALPPADRAAYEFLWKQWQEERRMEAERKAEEEEEKKRAEQAEQDEIARATAEAAQQQQHQQKDGNKTLSSSEAGRGGAYDIGSVKSLAEIKLQLLQTKPDDDDY